MSSRPLVLMLAAFLSSVACAPAVDVDAEEQQIRATAARWMELTRAQDAEGVVGLFDANGAIYWEDRTPAIGLEAIRETVARDFAENPDADGGFAPDRIDMAASGDLAVEHGTYQGANSEGHYVTVHRKIDGEWRILTDISVDTRPEGGAPDWATEGLALWYERFNARDAEGVADLYAADARVGDVQGRAAIIELFEQRWAERDPDCSGGFDEFLVLDSIASGLGHDRCTETVDGSRRTVLSTWLAHYERQADGSWLIIRDQAQEIGG